MKVGDKVKVTGLVVPKEWECGGVITELLPADGQWGKTAIVSFPNGEEVEYELTDLEVQTPEDTQAAVEDYVFWREAIEGVK